MNWISVKEELPSSDQLCLVWCESDEMFLAYYPKNESSEYNEHWSLQTQWREEIGVTPPVRYWTYLPEPPKENE